MTEYHALIAILEQRRNELAWVMARLRNDYRQAKHGRYADKDEARCIRSEMRRVSARWAELDRMLEDIDEKVACKVTGTGYY